MYLQDNFFDVIQKRIEQGKIMASQFGAIVQNVPADQMVRVLAEESDNGLGEINSLILVNAAYA